MDKSHSADFTVRKRRLADWRAGELETLHWQDWLPSAPKKLGPILQLQHPGGHSITVQGGGRTGLRSGAADCGFSGLCASQVPTALRCLAPAYQPT